MRGLAGRLSAMTSDGGVGGRYVWSMAATAWSLGNRPSIGLATPPKSHHEQNWPIKSHPDRWFVRKKTPRRIMPTKMSRAVDGQFSPTRRHIVPVSLNFLVCHIVNFPVTWKLPVKSTVGGLCSRTKISRNFCKASQQ